LATWVLAAALAANSRLPGKRFCPPPALADAFDIDNPLRLTWQTRVALSRLTDSMPALFGFVVGDLVPTAGQLPRGGVHWRLNKTR
jgi:hypothetical protein